MYNAFEESLKQLWAEDTYRHYHSLSSRQDQKVLNVLGEDGTITFFVC